jgi:integrase
LCIFYLYTGCRLSEALRLDWADVDLAASHVLIRETKNGDARPVFLPESAVIALANLPLLPTKKSGEPGRKGRVFRFAKSGALYELFRNAAKVAAIEIPERVAFHLFRHSFGAWMRRFAGLDTSGLVATGAWKSREAAAVYEHVETSEEARKAALLPVRKRVQGV